MNVLLTGGSGFIGSNLVRLLLAEGSGYRVANLDKRTYARIAENPPHRADLDEQVAVKVRARFEPPSLSTTDRT